MRIFLLLLLNCLSFCSFSQSDTLYFDSDWLACSKNDAIFYRVITPAEGGWKVVEMYSKTNSPFLVTFCTKLNPLTKNGKGTYYYANGKKSHEGNFADNKFTGVWTFWPEVGSDSTQSDYTPVIKVVPYKETPFLYNRNSTSLPPETYTPNKVLDSTVAYVNLAPSVQPRFEIGLRGKVAGLAIIEDDFLATYTIGMELTYGRTHCLGVDYTWFERWRQYDDSHDIEMYDEYELKKYFHIDYKWILYSDDEDAFGLYLNFYDKIGKYSKWYHPYDYAFGSKDVTFLQSTIAGPYNEPGAGVGIRLYDEESGLGFDTSINGGVRMTDYNERIYEDQYDSYFRDHVKTNQGVFYWRINLFYNFCKYR